MPLKHLQIFQHFQSGYPTSLKVEHFALYQLLMDPTVNRLQPFLAASGRPVCHIISRQHEPQTVPVSFPMGKRQAPHEFPIHDLSVQWWGRQRMRQRRGWHRYFPKIIVLICRTFCSAYCTLASQSALQSVFLDHTPSPSEQSSFPLFPFTAVFAAGLSFRYRVFYDIIFASSNP